MLSNEGKRRLATIVLFGLPILLVKATGMMFVTEGVDASVAAPVVAYPVPLTETPVPEAPLAQREASAYAHELRRREFGASPLLYQRPRAETPVVAERSVPEFTISAIMAAPSGNIAVIGGRYYRNGETLVGTTWNVIEIDAVGRSVTIEDPKTGEEAVRFVAQPR